MRVESWRVDGAERVGQEEEGSQPTGHRWLVECYLRLLLWTQCLSGRVWLVRREMMAFVIMGADSCGTEK